MAEKTATELKARDRNALIAFVVGIALGLLGLAAVATSDDTGGVAGAMFLAAAVLVVLGLVFYRRR